MSSSEKLTPEASASPLMERWRTVAASLRRLAALPESDGRRTERETAATTLEQCADELEAVALQAPRTPEWQDISTAPKDGTPVLLWEPEQAVRHDGVVMIGSYCAAVPGPNPVDAGWYDEVSGHYQIQATHWQPLPSPPPQVAPLGAVSNVCQECGSDLATGPHRTMCSVGRTMRAFGVDPLGAPRQEE